LTVTIVSHPDEEKVKDALPSRGLKRLLSGWLASAIVLLLAGVITPGIGPVYGQGGPGHPVWLPMVFSSWTASNPVHQGQATYYQATGEGACMFDPSPEDLMVAAMNAEEYNQAAVCGAFVAVNGPQGAVTVRIVDLCPECRAGHLDLSREAFGRIGDLSTGVVPITWQVVSPALSGPIAYHFKDGSNPWWTAVQIRNHRNPVAKLEYRLGDGRWVVVPRTGYNYFVQTDPGLGTGPYSFRVTDSYGSSLIDHDVPHLENGTIQGAGQFPPGPGVGP
jgi:expansin